MLTVFLFAAAAQFFFWGMFSHYAFPKQSQVQPAETGPFPPVSVIVCFRNEEEMIDNCLVSILKQEYPGDFEIVAVDDNSTDKSATIVRQLVDETDGRVRLLQPGPTRPGKKDALAFGINNARHEHILLTDADCLTRSHNWLILMTRPLRQGAEVVLGVGEYAYNGWKIIDRFQRFEAMYVALKYLSFARFGLPYMGVGRNLAYQKSFFQRSGGFAAHTDLPGGDDDLLIGNNALGPSTVCVTRMHARTMSRLSGSWPVFLRQRMRHQSVGFRYRPVHQVLLGLVALSHGLFFLLGLFLLFTPLRWLALFVYALRFLLVLRGFRRSGLQGANAGAKKGYKAQYESAWVVAVFDALLAPWYLMLGLLGTLPARRW
ncbi:glycosyltransferase [Neolewinella aurantiaca]|uniref:Glycosyltransferase n=2 Tax=Neolewinella aurantiaca TaxID=2602767 RepID=A0A5C7FWA1_9BACT|nr:glycosyltransferase [Neolewinella aurantiaca]